MFAAGGDGSDTRALEAEVGVKVVQGLAEVVGVYGGSAVQAAGAGDLAAAGQGDEAPAAMTRPTSAGPAAFWADQARATK
ncbi:hypothetical protein BEH93_28210 [Streptomyces sp. 2R]|nr:hypothetical protein BEH93_28210 [Streptomyces sp. 2R]